MLHTSPRSQLPGVAAARVDALAPPTDPFGPFDVVLFDLDGTLTNPEIGITTSYRYALAAVGRPVAEGVDLSWMIGPPIGENLVLAGVTQAELPVAIDAYRRRHNPVGLFEAELIPGMSALVERLHGQGVRIALATGKPARDGRLTLEHFGLAPFFEVIAGNTDTGQLNKGEVVADALRQLGNPDPSRVTMVGDRRHDVEGAAVNGITSIGVTWGFAIDGELAAARADVVVASVAELAQLLVRSPLDARPTGDPHEGDAPVLGSAGT